MSDPSFANFVREKFPEGPPTLQAIAKRKRGAETLYEVGSTKGAHVQMTIRGEIPFMEFVRAQYDQDILRVTYHPTQVDCADGEKPVVFEMAYMLVTGQRVFPLCCYTDSALYARISAGEKTRFHLAAERVDAKLWVITEKSFERKEWHHANCTALLAAQRRAFQYDLQAEYRRILTLLRHTPAVKFKDLLTLNCERGNLWAVIGQLYQRGAISLDMSQALTSRTVIRSRNIGENAENLVDAEFSFEQPQRISGVSLQTEEGVILPFVYALPERVPSDAQNLAAWSVPYETSIADSLLPRYRSAKLAVTMWATGSTDQEIYAATDLTSTWVRKLANKCLRFDDTGERLGFWACIPYYRTKPYTRVAACAGTKMNRSRGGLGGAFQNLIAKHPELETKLRDAVLESKPWSLKRPTWGLIHTVFIAYLREQGYTDGQYPFNTGGRAYKALCRYCNQFLETDPEAFIAARHGIDAVRRNRIGCGHEAVITPLRALQMVQIDYIKIDSSSVIWLETPGGNEIPVLLERWYIAVAVCSKTSLVLAMYPTLEVNPSAETTLEIVDLLLRPPPKDDADRMYSVTRDGAVFPNQLFVELAYQSPDVFLFDNALANAARKVLAGITRTTGAIIQFGQVGAWWKRSLVEYLQGRLTKLTAQRLASTAGSNPTDTIKTDPDGKAIELNIRYSEIVGLLRPTVRYLNEFVSSTKMFQSAIDDVRHCIQSDNGRFLAMPIPHGPDRELPLLWDIQRVKVTGDPTKGIAPHINAKSGRWTNAELAAHYSYVGCGANMFVYRRDARRAFVVVDGTNEKLDLLPPKQWRKVPISLRDMDLITRWGRDVQMERNSELLEPVVEYANQKAEQIADADAEGRTSKKNANALARLQKARQQAEAAAGQSTDNSKASVDCPDPNPSSAPVAKVVGFMDDIDMKLIRRK